MSDFWLHGIFAYAHKYISLLLMHTNLLLLADVSKTLPPVLPLTQLQNAGGEKKYLHMSMYLHSQHSKVMFVERYCAIPLPAFD